MSGPLLALSAAPEEEADYAGVLAGVAQEAMRAAELCHRLQESALHLLDNYSGPDRARLMSELQHLDAVTQMLTGLANFSSATSEQARAEAPLDLVAALAHVTLSDMAKRLRYACRQETHDDWGPRAAPRVGPGEIDLF